MRNYLKLRCVRIVRADDPSTFYVQFGGDDESLLFYAMRTIAELNSSPPTHQYFISEPSVIWFELNLDNFIKMTNMAAGTFWTQSRLNTEGPPFEGDNLYDMTRVEVEGSPRKTWSHGH